MTLIELTAVVEGEDLDPDLFERLILGALEEEADEIDGLYRQFYGSWDDDHPSMRKEVVVRGGDAYAEVSTRGRTGEKGNRKLLWLDDGTRVRWAVMSDNWQSKTSPGRIRSGRGRGRVRARGKKATHNARRGKPGLEPRNVSINISEERESPFQVNINDAIERAAR